MAQVANVAHATTRTVRLAMAEADAATVDMEVDALGVAAPTAASSAIGCGGEMRLLAIWRRWPRRWRRRQARPNTSRGRSDNGHAWLMR